MKIREALAAIDEQEPNGYSEEAKIRWLSKLDGMIQRLILETHEGLEPVSITYNMDTDRETVLLAPAPFDTMYLRWLEAQMAYSSHEYDGYNNAIQQFNAEWQQFECDYNRNHRHKDSGKRFRF